MTSTIDRTFGPRLYAVVVGLLLALTPVHSYGQLSPEIGYMLPSGGKAGTSTDVVIGGYDWTPDMQVFVHDPRIKLELVGNLSPVLIAEPPYWFGYKARGYAWPLPREIRARLTIPADVTPGLVRWQVGNANGASPVAQFQVGHLPEVAENPNSTSIQELPALPIAVSGQIRRIEEVDRYRFSVPTAGPVTLELLARRIGSPLHGMLKVKDPAGKVILDVADTEGRDVTVTMHAEAAVPYEVSLHDLDFAGDRSYVYRLTLTAVPQVTAAYPAGGKRGQTQSIEFVGIGLATGGPQLENVRHNVTFPTDVDVRSIDYSVQTAWGATKPIKLLVSDLTESVKPVGGGVSFTAPAAVTSAIENQFGSDEYQVTMSKGQPYEILAAARALGSPLDLDLTILDPAGKQLATNDDAAGCVDPEIAFTAPEDGVYKIVVADRSGKSGFRGANYRLSVSVPQEELDITLPAILNVPLGGSAKLSLKATRKGGFKNAVPIVLTGLPAGVTAVAELALAEGQSELAIDLTCAADSAVSSALCTVTATPTLGGRTVSRTSNPALVAITMKPRFKLTPEGLDDVRKVHRGSTYLFPMLIERLEGYAGPINLEMTAKQQRHRQGLSSDEFLVPADTKRIEYPIFVPEWMETTKTSRMILNGSAQVADPKGTLRTLLQRQELRFGILPEGALMKLTHNAGEVTTTAGSELLIPLSLSVAPELHEPIQISVISEQGDFSAEMFPLAAGQKELKLPVRVTNNPSATGDRELRIRATALRDGRWPVIAETTIPVTILAK